MPGHYTHHNHVLLCAALVFANLTAYAAPEQQAEDKPQATADAPQTKQVEPDIASGKATQAWMQAQTSGVLASKHRPVLSGPVLSKIQAHYIKMFESPTKDEFSKIN